MKNKSNVFIFAGLLLIAAALLLTLRNYCENAQAEDASRDAVNRLEALISASANDRVNAGTGDSGDVDASDTGDSKFDSTGEEPAETPSVPSRDDEEIPDYVLNPEMEMPTQAVAGVSYIGIIYFPTLNLKLPVIDVWNYKNLKIAPCRYSGSAYSGNFVVCAHNYTSHFGKIGRLRIGDEVVFTDVDGNEFRYEVAELDSVKPTDVDSVTNEDWDLTLFTCTMSGKRRITVRCIKTSG